MTIKNYFVRGTKLNQGVKGVKYAKYLISENHVNHKNTKIVEIFNSSHNWMNSALLNAAKINTKKSIYGGRPTKRFGHSFVFSLPKGTSHPNKTEWKKLTGIILATLAKKLNVDRDILLKNSYIVAHNQENPHIHILVGSVLQSKTYNQQLCSERTVYALKNSFNYACLKVLGLNHLEYIPTEIGNPRISKLKYEKKLLINSQKYFKKWIQYTFEENTTQSKRQMNRLIKSIDMLYQETPVIAEELIKTIELKIPNIRKAIRRPTHE
jgi:hypothetical protein